uniref:Uncharacterized protein n=1 Tax=Arundo donax TaxID=35708 RepID=A0A0A9AIE8_ARUDO
MSAKELKQRAADKQHGDLS